MDEYDSARSKLNPIATTSNETSDKTSATAYE
jgi:hypothetical protein